MAHRVKDLVSLQQLKWLLWCKFHPRLAQWVKDLTRELPCATGATIQKNFLNKRFSLFKVVVPFYTSTSKMYPASVFGLSVVLMWHITVVLICSSLLTVFSNLCLMAISVSYVRRLFKEFPLWLRVMNLTSIHEAADSIPASLNGLRIQPCCGIGRKLQL